MRAKSINGKSIEEIQTAFAASISDGFRPTLAVVFMFADLNWQAVVELLDSKDIEIFGATAEIEFTESGIQEQGIVILLMDMNKSHFRVILNDFEKSDAMQAAEKVGEMGMKMFSNPAYIISGSLSDLPGELLMDGIVNKVGSEVSIIGGMAGDTVSFSGPLFTNRKSCSQGIISLIIDNDKIDLKGVAVSGYKPVGTEKVITKSEGAWIQTIDGKPAMEVIWQFIGRDIEETKISDNLIMLNTSYPLQFSRKVGKPVIRPTVMYNTETKAVYCGSSVEEGSKFRFSLPPDFEVIDAVVESSKQIKATELEDADALIIFSCVGRYGTLGPMTESENEGLAKTWGKPMAGFFSLGEFGKVNGGEVPEFHGGTCCWVAIKEK